MCSNNGIISELRDLVNQIDNGCESNPPVCAPAPCYPPSNFPFAQVTMNCPPPILAPTRPEPVKPLGLFCPETPEPPLITPEERVTMRYDNFYNYYNVDWHPESPRYRNKPKRPQCTPEKQRGQIFDGSSPCCDRCIPEEDNGCPTGFKPCTMKLTAPPACDPCGIWFAEVQPCPPKPKKYEQFQPGDAYKKCQK